MLFFWGGEPPPLMSIIKFGGGNHLNDTTFTKNIKLQRPICQPGPPWSGRVDRTSANDDGGSQRDWKRKNV